MLTVTSDPALTLVEREAAFARIFRNLRALSIAQVEEDLGDDLAAAEHSGEASAARDALVQPIGGHKLVVDPDLYAMLDDDDGMVVVSGFDEDVNPPSVVAAAEYVEPEVEPAALAPAIAEANPEPLVPEGDTYADEVATMTGDNLRDALREAGLPVSGKVADLRDRLIANHTTTAG